MNSIEEESRRVEEARLHDRWVDEQRTIASLRQQGWMPPPVVGGAPVARTNIDDALEIVHEIDRVRAVQRELKSAFARNELDGGIKTTPQHPLYIECEARLEVLHEQLMMVI